MSDESSVSPRWVLEGFRHISIPYNRVRVVEGSPLPPGERVEVEAVDPDAVDWKAKLEAAVLQLGEANNRASRAEAERDALRDALEKIAAGADLAAVGIARAALASPTGTPCETCGGTGSKCSVCNGLGCVPSDRPNGYDPCPSCSSPTEKPEP